MFFFSFLLSIFNRPFEGESFVPLLEKISFTPFVIIRDWDERFVCSKRNEGDKYFHVRKYFHREKFSPSFVSLQTILFNDPNYTILDDIIE